jgi:hypothetical protein
MEDSFNSNELQKMYKDFTNRRIDAKTLNYWKDAITSCNQSLKEFGTFIASSSDYINNILSIFNILFLENIGREADVKEINKFLRDHTETLVDESHIKSYIFSLNVFSEHCHSLINSLGGENFTKHQTEILVERFKNNANYDIDALTDDINNISSIKSQGDECLSKNNSAGCLQISKIIQEDGLNIDSKIDSYISSIAQYPIIDEVSGLLKYVINDSVNTKPEWVEVFQEIFKRPIFLEEYLKYDATLSALSHDLQVKWIQSYINKYNTIISSVTEIVSKYIGNTFNEYDFIRLHINDIDCDTFINDMRDQILSSTGYKDKMSQVLSVTYAHVFDKQPSQIDVDYLFSKALSLKLSLQDEQILQLLIEFKKETDTFSERIYRLFLDIYQRDPDEEENSKYIPLYRNTVSEFENIDNTIAQHLMCGFEFHDVLKKKIRSFHLESKNTDITPSMLYRILKACLDRISNIVEANSFNKVNDIVKDIVLSC